MRHKKSTQSLGRKTGPRRALLRTLVISLIENGEIRTTPVKARVVRRMAEKLITKGKVKTPQSIRLIEKRLGNKMAALRVVNDIAPRFKSRDGGYTRMMKVADRKGDGAQQVILKWVD